MRLAYIGIGILVVAVVVLMFVSAAGGDSVAGLHQGEFARLAALLALLIVLGGSIAGSRSMNLSSALRASLTWLALLLALVVLYLYFGDYVDRARF